MQENRKEHILKSFIILLAIFVLIMRQHQVVYANTPAEPLKNMSTVVTKPNLPSTTYSSDFTWGSAQTLHGIYSSSELYFTIPSYWDANYACIKIEYRVSQLINGVPCTLTFSINKQPFYSCAIAYNNNEIQSLYVLIPKELLKNDGDNNSNYLQVSGYARLYDKDGCVDDYTDASWITISETSGVQIGYEEKKNNNRIDYYPYPFMSSLNPTGKDTAIVVADTSQDEEVATAVSIMSNISNEVVAKNEITVGEWDELKNDSFKNRIYIGLTKDTPIELKKYINQYENQLKDQTLILLVNDDKNQPMLLIVSDDKKCLMEAGYFLADKERVFQEKGNITFIKNGSANIKISSKQINNMQADRYTLESITGGGLNFLGPFHQAKTLFLPVSGDYTLSSDGKISVNFRYSKNLDFRRSMLTVYWGNIPIGSKKLTLEKADGDELTFFMPADVIGTKSSKAMFAFDLEIPDLFCTTRQEEMPWAYITPNSSIYLPAENDVKLEFDNSPAPFQKGGRLNDVLLITSNHPSSSELTLLGRTIAVYGKGADAYGNLKVCKVSEFSEKDANYNIIISGTPSTNSLIPKINDKLYFKYSKNGMEFLTNEKLILSTEYAKSIGTLQLIKSPYAQNRAMLILTGPSSDTLKIVDKLNSYDKLRWNLKYDCVVIDSEEKIKSYQFQKNTIENKKPTLVQSLTENKNSFFFSLLGTSVMLVVFLAMILILLRLKIIRKSKQ